MSYSNYYDAQRQYEHQRALAIGHRIGQLEAALNLMGEYAEQSRRDAQQQAYLDNLKRIQARAAQANAPATPTAPDVVDGNARFHPSHLRRPQPVQSIKDPLVSSVGANVRMGK